MRNKVGFLIVILVCLVILICSGCANRNCSILKFATEQATITDQQLKRATIEQIDDSLKDIIIITTISWNSNAISFLSEEVEIEERKVILYGIYGQMDADVSRIIPMSANHLTIHLPIGKDCFVYINGKRLLFPREVD